MGALALLGGALLGGSLQLQTVVGLPQGSSPRDGARQDPVATKDAEKGTGGRSRPAASSVRGASESARHADPTAKDGREAAILAVLDELDHLREGKSNVPREDGRMLRLLTESLGARNVVEIGTSNGYSGLWFCLALEKTGGRLTTFDIDEGRFELARANFKRAGMQDRVTQVLGDAHQEVSRLREPIDVLFIDADKEGYLDYLTQLLPLVRPGGLILSHNMARPYPDPRFVKAISTNPDLETLFVNMHDQGLGITLKKR
jgi:predicted O-methyltransferase YrrM